MALKRGHDALQSHDPRDSANNDHNIFESSSIEDRASKFVGLFSPDLPAKTLQAHAAYKKASHRILAWRKPSSQQSLSSLKPAGSAPKVIYVTGYDDDGESYAGKKLERLLIDLDVVGAVVVARWYGGVLLGPVRFAHIENVAKEAIAKWRTSLGTSPSPKKVKTDVPPQLTPEEEAEQTVRLIKLLGNRDNSIAVLRGLLAEKNALKVKDGPSSGDIVAQAPVKSITSSPNYSSMALNKLQQLEKARDTTISWILKQIDEAEAKASMENKSDASTHEKQPAVQ